MVGFIFNTPFDISLATQILFHVKSKTNPVTMIINLTINNVNLKTSFNILILQMDFGIVALGRFSLPVFLLDALNHHFNDSDESSNFKGKLCK